MSRRPEGWLVLKPSEVHVLRSDLTQNLKVGLVGICEPLPHVSDLPHKVRSQILHIFFADGGWLLLLRCLRPQLEAQGPVFGISHNLTVLELLKALCDQLLDVLLHYLPRSKRVGLGLQGPDAGLAFPECLLKSVLEFLPQVLVAHVLELLEHVIHREG